MRALLCARNCTCRAKECDVCGARCSISLADGGDIAFPVRCNNKHLYDALSLKEWIEHISDAEKVEVIPGLSIEVVETMRSPFANVVRVIVEATRFYPRRSEVGCQTESDLTQSSLSPPLPPSLPAPPPEPKALAASRPSACRLPRHHPFPRAVVRNAPRAVCSFSLPPE